MNIEKYDKKTQEKLQSMFKEYKIIITVFTVLSFILIIYGALTESWIRFLAGVITMFTALIIIGITKQETDKIEEEVKKIKSEKGEDDKN